MARRKTHEEFVAEVKALVGDEYTVITAYKNNHTKITFTHDNCGLSYDIRPKDFIKGTRCPICSKKKGGLKRRTEEKEFLTKILAERTFKHTILSGYEKARKPLVLKCGHCGEVFERLPANLLKSHACPVCTTKKKRLDSTMFASYLHHTTKGEYRLVSDYVNNKTKVSVMHTRCAQIYEVVPYAFKRGNRCPICKESKGERYIREWLSSKGIKHNTQEPAKYDKRKHPLYLDFYVQGIAIEYDGEYHYKPMSHAGREEGLRAQQRRDAIKTQYCADNGIPLIRIPYWDFDNIDAILTEKLLPLLEIDANVTQKQAS